MGAIAAAMRCTCCQRRDGADGAKKCQVCDSGAKIFKVSCRLGGVPRRICI